MPQEVLPSGARPKTSRSRAGLLVCDPVLKWGTTAEMGVAELLDAVDRAQRAATMQDKALWERLACRAQALMLKFTASQLCRLLFAFHRGRLSDESLLAAACETIADTEANCRSHLNLNEAALLLKAFSKHDYVDSPSVDVLLSCVANKIDEASTSDVCQILIAVIRLGVTERLNVQPCASSGGTLVGRLFHAARVHTPGMHVPPADVTNLCVAASRLPPSEDAAIFLLGVFQQLTESTDVALLSPRDVVRRLIGVASFDEALLKSSGSLRVEPVCSRIGSAGIFAIYRVVAASMGQRAEELHPENCVEACEAIARILNFNQLSSAQGRAHEGSIELTRMRPIFALLLQRLPTISPPLLDRAALAAKLLSEQAKEQDDILTDLRAALRKELAQRSND